MVLTNFEPYCRPSNQTFQKEKKKKKKEDHSNPTKATSYFQMEKEY